jgi:hypothetical protein
MAAYTIFPIEASGLAHAFIAADLENDSAAAAEAIRLLDDHMSATQVTVWREDRLVFSRLSRSCAVWLAGGAERGLQCPSALSPGMPCSAICGRAELEPSPR